MCSFSAMRHLPKISVNISETVRLFASSTSSAKDDATGSSNSNASERVRMQVLRQGGSGLAMTEHRREPHGVDGLRKRTLDGRMQTELWGGAESHASPPEATTGIDCRLQRFLEIAITHAVGFRQPVRMGRRDQCAKPEGVKSRGAVAGDGGNAIVRPLALTADRRGVQAIECGGILEQVPVFIAGARRIQPGDRIETEHAQAQESRHCRLVKYLMKVAVQPLVVPCGNPGTRDVPKDVGLQGLHALLALLLA